MVRGLEIFREHFRDYAGQYMLIGGTACSVLLEEGGFEFRITKDLDIVLCAEALTDDFFRAFWSFVKAGGYQIRQRSDGRPQLYRFAKPTDSRYPGMLEIFSRKPGFVSAEDIRFAPVPSDDEAYSLSAILLDDAYYELVRSGAVTIDGLTVVSANYLIPLKIRAYMDLRTRRAAGGKIDNEAVQKHKKDVLRLMNIADNVERLPLPGSMKQDVDTFAAIMREERPVLRDLGITNISLDDMLENLEIMYS